MFKLLFAAAGLGEVASERSVDGGALLQKTVGVHKIGHKSAGIDCQSDTMFKDIVATMTKHDELMLAGDGSADFDGLISASKAVDESGEKFGKGLEKYFMGLHQAASMCMNEAPTEVPDSVCAINGLISGIMEHFHKLEPTFGQSPLGICALENHKDDVAMWLKALDAKKQKPRGGGEDKKPREGGEDKKPREGGEDKEPRGPPEGAELSVGGDCASLWDNAAGAAQETADAWNTLLAAVEKHGEALANAGDLTKVSPDELRHVCEVGMGMAYARGIAALVNEM